MFRPATSDRIEAKNDGFLPGGDGGVCEKLWTKLINQTVRKFLKSPKSKKISNLFWLPSEPKEHEKQTPDDATGVTNHNLHK